MGAADAPPARPIDSALVKIRAEPNKSLTKTWLQQLAPEELLAVVAALALEPQTTKPKNADAISSKLVSFNAKRLADVEGRFTDLDKVRRAACMLSLCMVRMCLLSCDTRSHNTWHLGRVPPPCQAREVPWKAGAKCASTTERVRRAVLQRAPRILRSPCPAPIASPSALASFTTFALLSRLHGMHIWCRATWSYRYRASLLGAPVSRPSARSSVASPCARLTRCTRRAGST